MKKFRTTHTGNVEPRLERPLTGRPSAGPSRRRPAARPIHEVLAELAGTRQRYEDLRLSSGCWEERARLTSLLHDLRAEASLARNSLGML